MSLPDDLTYMEEDGDEEFTVNDETLQRRARHLNNVINHFCKRWNKEYLLELRTHADIQVQASSFRRPGRVTS